GRSGARPRRGGSVRLRCDLPAINTCHTFQQMATQPDLAADLVRMLVDRILEEVFPDETGAARLQEVGLFTLIFMLQNDEAPVTATRLAEMTGQATSRVSRLLRR